MVDSKWFLGYNSCMKSSAVDLAFTECCFYATLKNREIQWLTRNTPFVIIVV